MSFEQEAKGPAGNTGQGIQKPESREKSAQADIDPDRARSIVRSKSDFSTG
jgi:hypothetical protein